MNKSSSSANEQAAGRRSFLILLAVLAGALCVLFFRSFLPNQVLYSNDGPLGLISATAVATSLGSFSGMWIDLNWLGNEGITAAPTFTILLSWLLTPVGFAKFSVPIVLLAVGLCAWVFFRQLKLAPLACVLGGMAAALNSDFFSTSCWGVVAVSSCVAASYLALAAMAKVTDPSASRPWLRVTLAGIAVGMVVMEAYDVGALFSLFVGAYVIYQALFLNEREGATGKRAGLGLLRLALVAGIAAITASHVLTSLVGTQIASVMRTSQDRETKKGQWPGATQWSLPPVEVAQVFVPGVFGYRQYWHMYDNEQPGNDKYWGRIGELPNIEEIRSQRDNPNPQVRAQVEGILNDYGNWRLSGTGLYAGILVVVVSLWTILQSLRKTGSPFSLQQRRAIWFWTAVLIATTLLAFGRYIPIFYKLFYSLPYASAIRNPTKFMHIFSWALVIVFAYGVHGLYATYMQNPVARANGILAQFKNWRVKATAFERKWMIGCVCAIGVAVLGWLIYGASLSGLKSHLTNIGISGSDAPDMAKFSFQAVTWFVFFLILTVGLLAALFSGQFAGPRARLGGVLLGTLLLVDLGRADKPWMVYFDTTFKYADDPVVSFLADKPYEHRVSFLPWLPPQSQQLNILQSIYGTHWKQHLFWLHDVQCVDMAQESRVGADKETFVSALNPSPKDNPQGVLRHWELTGTRYLLGSAGPLVDALNTQLDPKEKRFRIANFPDGKPVMFDLKLKRENPNPSGVDFVAAPKPDGQLAVVEFTGALPRASLFSNWQVETNDANTLAKLANTGFDVHQTVLVANSIPASPPDGAGQPPGDVKITSYAPKRIELEADAKTAAVLLLCDRYNEKWQVTVDGQPKPLLRCNYIQRGVFLEPGKHKIVFAYNPPITTLYASLGAIVLGLGLVGFLAFSGRRVEPETAKQPKRKPAKS